MLEIEVTATEIIFALCNDKRRRVYPYTPALHDAVQRALDARTAAALVQYEDHVTYTPSATEYPPHRDRPSTIYVTYPHQHKRLLASGTAVDERADPLLVSVLESARIARREYRVKLTFDYSTDPADSESGYIGRTSGKLKELILCNNARSLGGGLISLRRVIRVEYANKQRGGALYQCPA